ncbi:hypothetical protein N2152v2_009690 [Parachlorella kessleri]
MFLITQTPSCRAAVLTAALLCQLIRASAQVRQLSDPAAVKVPPGFKLEIYKDEITNARSMTVSRATGQATIVYVGSRGVGPTPAAGTPEDKVWALVDRTSDGVVDLALPILSGYANPNGVLWHRGSLYVGLPTRILRLDNIDSYALRAKAYDKEPIMIIDSLPPDGWHGTKVLRIGPDGKIYFGVGVRNSVGWDWHPKTKALFFTDNDVSRQASTLAH